MSEQWLRREALIAVKAYPNPSAKYGETVCVAAITREEGWVRLYPVRFRTLPKTRQFQKYQRVSVRIKKHGQDSRPESYRLDERTIELGEVIQAKGNWAERRAWIQPTLSPSMCEIRGLQEESGKSLGAFRPKQVTDLLIEEASTQWTPRQQAAMGQMWLFDKQAKALEKIPYVFKYRYTCAHPDCGGHEQSILDWELMELYRKLRDKGDSPDTIRAKVRDKFLGEICSPDRDTIFFVGSHRLHHQSFMVLGTFWPRKQPPTLFDA